MKRRIITKEELNEFLRKHKLWLNDDLEGEMADLRWAYLRGADLRGADLRGAYLQGADLRGADLQGAYLRGADLRGAYLRVADLRGAYLQGADLRGADLQGADLQGAYLRGEDLQGAEGVFLPIACPEKGAFTAFKKASGYIVELLIPEDARRCSASGRKCRCDKAFVVSITKCNGEDDGLTSVNSDYRHSFVYTVGETVEEPSFNDDRWDECSEGIHFFITRQEAVNYT